MTNKPSFVMAERRCPVCDRLFDPATSPAMPFCSDRCRQIDLGRWLGEKYSMPYERPEQSEDLPGHDE